MMDSDRLKWMGPVYKRLADDRSEQRAFDFGYPVFCRTFAQTTAELQIEVVPYQGRHSGINIDLAMGLRSLGAAAKRGRWQSMKSVRRYEKAGRLNGSWLRLPDGVRKQALRAERLIERAMLSRVGRP